MHGRCPQKVLNGAALSHGQLVGFTEQLLLLLSPSLVQQPIVHCMQHCRCSRCSSPVQQSTSMPEQQTHLLHAMNAAAVFTVPAFHMCSSP
jgi:hypothetical protein